VITGIIRLGIALALDLIVLFRVLDMTPMDYVMHIGLRCLEIPARVFATDKVAGHVRGEGNS
jgi:hypothetical protein